MGPHGAQLFHPHPGHGRLPGQAARQARRPGRDREHPLHLHGRQRRALHLRPPQGRQRPRPRRLHAAGVPPPKALAVTPAGVHDDGPLAQVIDGETFLPVLLGRRDTVRADGADRPLLWHYPNFWGEGIPGPEYHFYSALRLGRWKLIYQHPDQTFELYDLRTDIGERRDLADQRPGLVDKLRREMGRLLRERGAQMPRIGGPAGKPVPFPDEVALSR